MPTPQTQTVMQEELPRIAREARQSAGLTQQEVADKLGVANPSVSRAETRPGGRYLNLQRRIIEEIGGWELRGPLWEVERSAED